MKDIVYKGVYVVKIAKIQNGHQNFGMSWVHIKPEADLNPLTIARFMDSQRDANPMGIIGVPLTLRLAKLNSDKYDNAKALIQNIHENSPNHSVFYEQGLLYDKLHAVPRGMFSPKVCYFILGEGSKFDKRGVTTIPVVKCGEGVLQALKKLSKKLPIMNSEIARYKAYNKALNKELGRKVGKVD